MKLFKSAICLLACLMAINSQAAVYHVPAHQLVTRSWDGPKSEGGKEGLQAYWQDELGQVHKFQLKYNDQYPLLSQVVLGSAPKVITTDDAKPFENILSIETVDPYKPKYDLGDFTDAVVALQWSQKRDYEEYDHDYICGHDRGMDLIRKIKKYKDLVGTQKKSDYPKYKQEVDKLVANINSVDVDKIDSATDAVNTLLAATKSLRQNLRMPYIQLDSDIEFRETEKRTRYHRHGKSKYEIYKDLVMRGDSVEVSLGNGHEVNHIDVVKKDRFFLNEIECDVSPQLTKNLTCYLPNGVALRIEVKKGYASAKEISAEVKKLANITLGFFDNRCKK